MPIALIVIALSLTFIEESRDPSRTSQIDWLGAALAVVGLGGVVFGLLEWPARGATDPLVVGAAAAGVVALALLFAVERRARNPMLPLDLFRSRPFALANLLTLLLYAAVGVVMFLVPMNLIQVQGYTPTQAGAALLPWVFIMFALSRWSGGLVARRHAAAADRRTRDRRHRSPVVRVTGIGGSLDDAFPAIGGRIGHGHHAAPLTTTVMTAAETGHAGAAPGVNNAVRVAGLLRRRVRRRPGATFDARARRSIGSN